MPKKNKTEQKVKKLTLVNITKEHKAIDEYETVNLLDGKYEVKIAKTFLKSKIHRFLMDLQEILIILKKENIDTNDLNNFIILYQMCLLKNFTDLPLQHLDLSKKQNIIKLLNVASQLIDLGILEEIISKMPQKELTKIDETLKKSLQLQNEFGDLFATAIMNEQERLKELENKV